MNVVTTVTVHPYSKEQVMWSIRFQLPFLIISTLLLTGVVLIPWGAARGPQIITSVALVAAVGFLIGFKFTKSAWLKASLWLGVFTAAIFGIGEFINRGENWWILGFLMYAPIAIVLSALCAGFGYLFGSAARE